MSEGPNHPSGQQQQPGGGRGRRRRRGRRGPGAKPGQPGQQQGQPVQQNQSQPQSNHHQQNQGGGGGGFKRRKRFRGGKKFGKSQRQPGGGQPSVFSAPMDHNYRANGNVNGNVEGNGNGNGNGAHRPFGRHQNQPVQVYNEPHLEPVAANGADATRIFCFIEDLFFLAKINETARKLNVKVQFVKSDKDVLEAVETNGGEKPSLIIFDLNNHLANPLKTIPKLKKELKKDTNFLGFVSHIQGDLKLKALEAGCDTVVPRSAFSQNLPNLLRRHGAPDELEEVD